MDITLESLDVFQGNAFTKRSVLLYLKCTDNKCTSNIEYYENDEERYDV